MYACILVVLFSLFDFNVNKSLTLRAKVSQMSDQLRHVEI